MVSPFALYHSLNAVDQKQTLQNNSNHNKMCGKQEPKQNENPKLKTNYLHRLMMEKWKKWN